MDAVAKIGKNCRNMIGWGMVCLTVAMASVVPAYANTHVASSDTGAMGVFHRRLVMNESLVGQDLKKQLEAQYQALQEDHNKKSDDFAQREEELMRQKAVLSAEAFEQEVKKFRTNAMEAQRALNMRKMQLDEADKEVAIEVNKRIMSILSAVLAERRLSVILESEAVALPGPQMVDITQDVLTRLNKELPKMALKIGSKSETAEVKTKKGAKNAQ